MNPIQDKRKSRIVINFAEQRYNDYELKKVEENVYLYSDDRRGGVSIVFARFFPAENKMVVIRQPFGNNPDTYIAQKGAFNLSEADNQKLKDFQAYTLNYLVKHRVAYFANFKSNTSADLPQAKIEELTRKYFEDGHSLTKVKLVTSAWTLERNEFGRTMRRLHTILAYLKDKKTGKCYVAFRHIGQEFDGSSYGDVVFYKREETYYDLVDDKKNTLQVFLLNAEYEIPCNEATK